jgi:hypothetical protein
MSSCQLRWFREWRAFAGLLGCFTCSRNCSGNTRRCSLSDTFVTCKDGVF